MDSSQISNQPVAWVRFCSDGGIEGPIMDSDRRMDGRRESGAWTPLYAAPLPAQPQGQGAEPDDGFEGARRFLLGGLYEAAPPSQAPEPAQQEAAGATWQDALRISELLQVHTALEEFSHDSTEDAAVALVQVILEAASLPSPAPQEAVPSAYQRKVRVPLNAVGDPVYEERWIPCGADDQGAIAIQACRPADRAMLSTDAGRELLRAASAALASPVVSDSEIRKIWESLGFRTKFSNYMLEFAHALLSRAAPVVAEWKPIETAPFDIDLLTFSPSGHIHQDYRSRQYPATWTHWMPLPASPSAAQGEGT